MKVRLFAPLREHFQRRDRPGLDGSTFTFPTVKPASNSASHARC